jgi:ribonuclease BN (tRNA processing enzyme)
LLAVSESPTVSLRVLGCGDAFGSGGRSHTSFFLDAPDAKLLIDFGASALVAMHRLGIDPGVVDAVVLSHLHGDHFGGLPFLLLDAAFISCRSRPLIVAGPPGTDRRLRDAMDAMFPGHWTTPRRCALDFIELEDGRPISVAGATVTGYRVLHDSGAPAFALRVASGGRTIAYSGDTAWTDRLLDAARGADLFLCEASSFEAPIPNHLTYQTVAANRDRFAARHIVLTHLGDDVLSQRDRLALDVAEDGQLFVLD